MKLFLQICLLALCAASVYAKYKTADFTDQERWDATLQGIAHADAYIQSMEKAGTEQAGKSNTAAAILKNFFRKASAKSVAMGKARIKMEKAVEHAERILLEKKRLETARVASQEERAEIIAQELYHKPGSILAGKELAHIYQLTDCEELRPENITCSTIPFYHSVRTISGICNNLEHPTQGASFTPFQRILQAQYSNGINSLFNQAQAVEQGPFLPPFPSARLISDTALLDRVINDSFLTHLTMQWGQFMDHDLDLAVEFPEQDDCDLDDCEPDDICAPVRVPMDDDVFGEGTTNNGQCHPFQRTVPACVENPFEFTPREQVNELTHYIDGSMVYGSTDSLADFLREFEGGRLRTSFGDNLPQQPPCAPRENPLGEVTEGGDDCCMEGFTTCGVAGDGRALEHVSLTVMHTVWLREHNRVAAALSEVNPQWDDGRLYLEARNIVIAQIQRITFSEYLPALFGTQNFAKFIGTYEEYEPEVDASVPNAFATAAYRFGHSQIQPFFARLQANGESVEAGPLNLRDSFFSPTELDNGGGVAPIVRGWINQPARTIDEFLNTVLTTQLFESADNAGDGMDLATLNIQRGRDHGLPRYGTWKRFCRDTLGGIESDFRNELTAIRLRQLYGSDENIDLFVGALAEEPLPGSNLGAVLTCIFALTFTRLRDGDRFWYENDDPSIEIFTPDQLAQIRNTGFSKVLCDNGGIEEIQSNPFFQDNLDLNTSPCSAIEGIDFTPWREETFCFYRATVSTNAETLFTFFNRPTGSGGSDLSDFQQLAEGEEITPCVPFRCPGPDSTIRSDRRDVIVTVTPQSRQFACVATGGGGMFVREVTQEIVENDPAFFTSQEECEASSNTLLEFRCDGTVERKAAATTAELEKELAKVLKKAGSERAVSETITLLERRGQNGLEEVYGDDAADVLNSTDDLPNSMSSKKTAQTSARSHKASSASRTSKIDANKDMENDQLIDLLQATLQKLKHHGE